MHKQLCPFVPPRMEHTAGRRRGWALGKLNVCPLLTLVDPPNCLPDKSPLHASAPPWYFPQVLPRLESGSLAHSWVESRVGKLVWQGGALPFCKSWPNLSVNNTNEWENQKHYWLEAKDVDKLEVLDQIKGGQAGVAGSLQTNRTEDKSTD